MSEKATNVVELCHHIFHMCSEEVKTAYSIIVCPHLEYASTCWQPYTKCYQQGLPDLCRIFMTTVSISVVKIQTSLEFDSWKKMADLFHTCVCVLKNEM